ncbi:FAD-dependent oxidoreductase [Candidatus Poribacteria bacterium]
MLSSFLGLLILGVTSLSQMLEDGEVYLYLEAERFEGTGGWTIDAQFRQLMGSTYLLAAGIGKPVDDAITTVDIPKAGNYHLWVRCKDWHEDSPGTFQVLIDDNPSSTTFGTQKNDWSWIDGGAFELPQGTATVKLHDLTGYYGRCDAILLTTNTNFQPPNDVETIAQLRKALLSDPEPEVLDFDFVVVGGGYGGVCSSVQAARLGLRTALIQNRPCLGGNASKEVNVGPGGSSPHTSDFRETGICEEIAEGRFHEGINNWSEAIDLVIKDVPNLSIFLNTEGMRPVMSGKHHIAAVEAENVVTRKKYVFRAPVFADCTGDGAIAFYAGAEFRHGQEARDEFNESYAPEQPNPYTMGTSIIHRSAEMDTPQPFTPPSFAVKFTAEHFAKRKQNLVNGTWWIEYGGMLDTIEDAEEIRDEIIRVIFGAFDWAKNHDPETRDEVRKHKLVSVPTVGGKRESRRFMGDYILTQNDVENATLFPDRVAYGGWPIDLHPSPGIYGKDIPPAIFHHLDQIYSIPYRTLYTRDVDNLFLAGRHTSVTHVALGSTRLMQTIGLMGQAVGVAAYLCNNYDILPREVNPDHIEELQQTLLKWDAYIPQLVNKDPDDLCRGAKITASSSAPDKVVDFFGSEPRPERDAPCTMLRGQIITATEINQKKLSLYLKATDQKPVEARLQLRKGASYDTDREPLSILTAQVKPGDFRWVDFELPEPLQVGAPYFAMLEINPGLCWKIYTGSYGERVYGSPGSWTRMRGRYALRPYGIPVNLGNIDPEAAVDGLKWPMDEQAHQWRSEPGLPQWLEVDFGREVELNTVYLTFDTNIFGRFPSSEPGSEITVQDYRILYNDSGVWKIAFEEKDNWRRFRRHQLPAVATDKLRLMVLDARNGTQARLYEMRAYYER